MKILYLALVMCLACLPAQAQDKKKVDSLRQAYTKAKHDTMRVKILMEIKNHYINYYPDSTIAIAERMSLIAERSQYGAGKIDALNTLGIGYYTKGERAKGIAYMKQALGIAEKLQLKRKLAICYSSLGNAHNTEDSYVVALEYFQKALIIFEEQGNKIAVATVLVNIGNLFNLQGEYTKALDNFQKSFEIGKQLGDRYDMPKLLVAKGNAYDGLEKYEEAINTYKQVLTYEHIIAPKQKANTLGIIANTYLKQAQYDSAKVYFEMARQKQEKLKGIYQLTYIFDGLANLSIKQHNYPQAVEYAQKGWALAQQVGETSATRTLNKTLYLAYKGNKQPDKALEHYEVYKQIQDSLFTVDKAKALANLEAKDELRRKQDAFALLEKDKNLEIAQERNQKLALEKQREATELITLAKQEKDKRKQDSLYNLAQQKQLEADKFLAESKTQKLQILQAKEAKDAQQRILYVVLAGLAVALLLAYLAYRSRQAEKRAKNEVEAQKEEITIQAEQLETANKTKDQLFSIIAHDLRSPMMAFQGLNKQIKFFLAKDRPEKLEQLGENIEKASTRLNSLLDNLLQWAMLQKQVIRTNLQNVDLQEAVAHSVSHFEGLAQSQQVTLHQAVGKESITTDYNILQTILRNLLSNALKFTPEGGNIYLTYQREVFGGTPNTEGGTPNKEQGILSVRDTGAGMSAKQVANLFQGIQFQSQQGLRGEKGTGLGLQLCYELAQQINAALTVESEEGKGTMFSLVLHDIQASQ